MLIEILLAAVFFGAAAAIAWAAIQAWLDQYRVDAAYAELARELLASGEYRVVGGVFDRYGNRTASRTWTAQSLDDETRARFGSSDRIWINY
jgi:hypothetical protein